MKSQIVTTLSVIAVLGAAGGAFAANSSVLTTASSESPVIGTPAPVLVPVAPKGTNIPEDYRQRLAEAASATGDPTTGSDDDSTAQDVEHVSPAPPTPPTDGATGGSGSHSDDDDDHDEDHDDDHDEDHDEDESDDDD